MTKYQRLFTNDQRLLKFTTLKGVRKNSYEIISFLCKTNPKSSSPKINLSSFMTSKYVLIGHLVIQTTKPIQTQFKPIKANPNPICRKGKINAKCLFTNDYEKKRLWPKKQSQFKPNFIL